MPCNVNELFLRAHLLNALEATELYLVLVTGIGVGYSLESGEETWGTASRNLIFPNNPVESASTVADGMVLQPP